VPKCLISEKARLKIPPFGPATVVSFMSVAVSIALYFYREFAKVYRMSPKEMREKER